MTDGDWTAAFRRVAPGWRSLSWSDRRQLLLGGREFRSREEARAALGYAEPRAGVGASLALGLVSGLVAAAAWVAVHAVLAGRVEDAGIAGAAAVGVTWVLVTVTINRGRLRRLAERAERYLAAEESPTGP